MASRLIGLGNRMDPPTGNFCFSGGFSTITSMPNGIIHRKLRKLAFELKGDAWEPYFTFGQKAFRFSSIANKFNIP